MKNLLVLVMLIAGIVSTASAHPPGHPHRSPNQRGKHHNHHTRLNTLKEQKPVH